MFKRTNGNVRKMWILNFLSIKYYDLHEISTLYKINVFTLIIIRICIACVMMDLLVIFYWIWVIVPLFCVIIFFYLKKKHFIVKFVSVLIQNCIYASNTSNTMNRGYFGLYLEKILMVSRQTNKKKTATQCNNNTAFSSSSVLL